MLRPRLRWIVAWVVGGAAALFVANLVGGWPMLVVVSIIGCIWIALTIDGALTGWRLRRIGPPAALPVLLPIVALSFAAFLGGRALYWSHVAPSWWLLRSERAAFERAVAGGPAPPGVAGIERSGRRIAFPTINGMLGAWAGIVHDPTDRMASARGWNGGPVAADVRRTFGSDTIWCQRLDSRWFHCQFD